MKNNINIVRICEVVWVDDELDGDRIKYRMAPYDNDTPDDKDLPYAFPILPKMMHVKPKIGETVLALVAIANNDASERYYIGPVISQPHKMGEDSYYGKSRSFFTNSIITPDNAPSTEEDTIGAYFNSEDIGIYGRGKSDIQLTTDDVRIRCGVKKENSAKSKFLFNVKDPAFIKLKYYNDGLLPDNTGENKCNSTATIVADKINLIGTNSKEQTLTKIDREELVTDEDMAKLISKAHQLPYGDVLIEFLELFRDAFINHTHPYPMMKPVVDDKVFNLSLPDLKTMLSSTVRIN